LRLLVDQNLSRALGRRLADLYPGTAHVTDMGLERATDSEVWQWVTDNGLTLVTKDRDFERAAQFPGPPPKCILVMLGNASTDDAENLLRQSASDIEAFEHDPRRLLILPELRHR
jgi:predicted nuclease of predicted toxin-antitoxin system